VPVAPPQPAPQIQNVTDAAGDNPAVLYPGVPVQITINGSNFGGATGYLNFCRPGGSPCDFTSNNGLSEQIISWNDTQIVANVTLPTDAPTGGWLVYVSAMFWISGTDYMNPSMGNLDADAVPPGTPTYMIITTDNTFVCSGCNFVERDFAYQVMVAPTQPWSGPTGTGGALCEVNTVTPSSCTPSVGVSTNSCDQPGKFWWTNQNGVPPGLDQWSLNNNSLTPAGCGFNTVDVWNAVVSPSPVPIGKMSGYLHTDAISVNNSVSTASKQGNLQNTCINSSGTIPCPK